MARCERFAVVVDVGTMVGTWIAPSKSPAWRNRGRNKTQEKKERERREKERREKEKREKSREEKKETDRGREKVR